MVGGSAVGTPVIAPVVMAVVITTITVGLLPAWNVHLVPESVRRVFHFRYFGCCGYLTEYDMWKSENDQAQEEDKEAALALEKRFKPGDSIVSGRIGALGYYSNLHVYDRFGLVDRRVAMLPSTLVRSPGHDKKASLRFFYSDEPTILLSERIDGPPPSRKNPEYPLIRRVRMKAEEWKEWYRPSWQRYVPEVLPLKPSPDGSPNVLMVWRLIEEEPRVATLPRPERVATRKKRARKVWNDFFTGLDSGT